MKKIALLYLLLLTSQLMLAQQYTIKGRILEGQSLSPQPGVDIGFDVKMRTSTNENGEFELVVNEENLNDTLFINFLSYYNLKIVNLPKSKEIYLGQIPLYEYFFGRPLVHFDCGTFDFKCKQSRKQFWKEYNERRRDYFEKKNLLIGYYRLQLNGEQYAIDVNRHLINLNENAPQP